MTRKFLISLLVLPVLALGACGSDDDSGSTTSSGSGSEKAGGKLTLVAYSTPQEAYEKIIPKFGDTNFDQSYGSSGDQARAIEGGLPADVAALSLEPDITKLVEAGLVDEDWNSGEYKGFVTNSVVTFAVRKGNPKGIKTWDDLVKDGVEVITPNPFTSGGARWNIMAGYGAKSDVGKNDQAGLDYITALFKNVPVQNKSAREALQTFVGGKGDVLLAYENEALTAQAKGEELDFITPDQTILIENPVAVVNESKNKETAQKFVDFLREDEAQKIFAEEGYRPVNKALVDEQKFPTPSGLFTIDDLGGWAKVQKEFFDPSQGKVAKIFQDQGISTAKN